MSSRYILTTTIAVLALVSTSACQGPNQTSTAAPLTTPDQAAVSAQVAGGQIAPVDDELTPPTARQISHLEDALETVEDAPLDTRPAAALTGLMLSASGRIPAKLADDLLDYNRAASEKRALRLSSAIRNNIWLFDEVCGQSFAKVTKESMALSSKSAVSHYIWSECGFERYPLLDGAEQYVEISERVGLEPTIAYFIYGYLNEHGGAHPLESRLLWEMARGWAGMAVARR